MKPVLAVLAVAALAAGCASHAPAPVIERGAPAPAAQPTPKAATTAAPENRKLYTVKKGDTLKSIAAEHGRDPKDLAAWNSLDNPNRIQVGQQLRTDPPESEAPVAEVRPVVTAGPVPTAKPADASTETFKREPKGGKLAYSDQALARLREPAPAEQPAEKGAAKPEEKAPPPAGDDAIEWAWPASGKLLGGFSAGGGGKDISRGIDIAGALKDPVLAAAPGTVKHIGYLKGYGNFIVVHHSPTMLSVYAHIGKALVAEKQQVARGQKIAELGDTDADAPKLHFEIRRQGMPLDPLKYLPPR